MPDPSGTRIVVTDVLADSGPSIMNIATQIGEDLAKLAALLTPLHDYWTGTATDSWQTLQTAWNTAANDLMSAPGQLGAISNAASTNWNNYVDCETSNISSWQS